MRDNEYTSQQPGFKLVFVALVVAAIFGLSFRLYFSSQRMKAWIEDELARRPSAINLQFKKAEFSLARGVIPHIAIRLIDVEGRAARSCTKTPGFQISELFIPFRPWALLNGRVAIGVIHSENLHVDIDALRDRCEDEAEGASPSAQPAERLAASTASEKTKLARPWWSEKQFENTTRLIKGVSFGQLVLSFEKNQKTVVLEDVYLTAESAAQTLLLSSEVRVPPSLIYGQVLPPFSLEVTAKADAADVEISGHLGEGTLHGLASVKAIPGDVAIDAHLNLQQVPLSAFTTYLHQNQKISKDIRPRFLWLNCEIAVSGAAKGLFKSNPVALERCALEGDGATLVLDKAVIGPGQKIEPFKVNIGRIDIKKLFALLKREGPRGVMQQFGQISGEVEVRAWDDFEFKGKLESASFIFSQQAVRLIQPVPELLGRAAYKKGAWDAAIEGAKITGGAFDGVATLRTEANRDGNFDLKIKELVFHEDIQKLLTKGIIGNLAINGKGTFDKGRFKEFRGRIDMRKLSSSNLESPDAYMNVSIEADGRMNGTVRAQSGRMRRESRLFNVFKPLMFAHKFRDDWIQLKDFNSEIRLEKRVFYWRNAAISVPEANLRVRSSGILSDADVIDANVEAEHPRFKTLRWTAKGSLFSPTLEADRATKRQIDEYKEEQTL